MVHCCLKMNEIQLAVACERPEWLKQRNRGGKPYVAGEINYIKKKIAKWGTDQPLELLWVKLSEDLGRTANAIERRARETQGFTYYPSVTALDNSNMCREGEDEVIRRRLAAGEVEDYDAARVQRSVQQGRALGKRHLDVDESNDDGDEDEEVDSEAHSLRDWSQQLHVQLKAGRPYTPYEEQYIRRSVAEWGDESDNHDGDQQLWEELSKELSRTAFGIQQHWELMVHGPTAAAKLNLNSIAVPVHVPDAVAAARQRQIEYKLNTTSGEKCPAGGIAICPPTPIHIASIDRSGLQQQHEAKRRRGGEFVPYTTEEVQIIRLRAAEWIAVADANENIHKTLEPLWQQLGRQLDRAASGATSSRAGGGVGAAGQREIDVPWQPSTFRTARGVTENRQILLTMLVQMIKYPW